MTVRDVEWHGTCRVVSDICPTLEAAVVDMLSTIAQRDTNYAFVKGLLKANLVQRAIETVGEPSPSLAPPPPSLSLQRQVCWP